MWISCMFADEVLRLADRARWVETAAGDADLACRGESAAGDADLACRGESVAGDADLATPSFGGTY